MCTAWGSTASRYSTTRAATFFGWGKTEKQEKSKAVSASIWIDDFARYGGPSIYLDHVSKISG